jgi:hypothetical protein
MPLDGTIATCAWPGCGFRTAQTKAAKPGDVLLMEHYAARALLEHIEAAHAPR